MPQQGNKYTWNDKSSGPRIFSKIDWVFINGEWLDSMPTYMVRFLPEGISDHRPAKVSLIEERSRRRKSFQFCNECATHPQFLGIVTNGWKDDIQSCKMLNFVKKLKMLKKVLRNLNTCHFRNIIDEANEDRLKYHKLRRSSYLAELFLQQRSKVNWLKLGDDNTSYFYSVIKYRGLKQATTQLKDERVYGNLIQMTLQKSLYPTMRIYLGGRVIQE
ncbi:hypothetical protein R3W88_017516 [Solanum pinnatisectum]|uniref:Uncharacterized protein n=1 Tax=Solanum pinnatisectum TaxID=50273 RepID=A0AAV9L1C0_9SOLN|nr:hypothetical protein R3W88_017516 [Solanum pinnatisectum]